MSGVVDGAEKAVANAGKAGMGFLSGLFNKMRAHPFIAAAAITTIFAASAVSGGLAPTIGAGIGQTFQTVAIEGGKHLVAGSLHLGQMGLTVAPDVIGTGVDWLGNTFNTATGANMTQTPYLYGDTVYTPAELAPA